MRPLACVSLRWFPLLAALLWLAGVASGADRKKDEPRPIPVPPQPVPVTLTVARGGQVEIPLRAYGIQREPPRYLIRTVPAHGKLSAPRATSRDGAAVVYEPPVDLAVKVDKFTYAVANSAGVSAAADVYISIIDVPPQLIVPDALRFEAILAGTTRRQDFEIVNRGGSLSEGEVQVESPWRLEGPAAYRLKEGERQRFTLVFAPEAGGVFRTEMRYTSQQDHVTTLRGEAVAPFTLAPNPVTLSPGFQTPARSGTVEVANHTAGEAVLALVGGGRLHLPVELAIPAGGQVSLPILVEAADVAALEEEVTLSGAGVVLHLRVIAPVVPPYLRVPAEPVRLSSGRAPSAVAILENIGGREGFWRCEAAAPFLVSPEEVRLAPGARLELAIRCGTAEAGPYRTWIRLKGEQQTLEFLVEAEVSSTLAPASPVHAEAIRPRSMSVARDSGSTDAALSEESRPATLRIVPGVRIVGHTDSTITLQWPTTLTSGRPVRLEQHLVGLDAQREFREEWKAVPEVQIRVEGEQTTAELRKLRAATIHYLRVVPSAGGAPFFEIDAATAAPPARAWFSLTRLGLMLLLMIGATAVWRRFRQERTGL